MERERILVVDDDDAWLRTIELILDGKYELELTKDPLEAMSLAKSSFFSLAILDQHISADLSGSELFMLLRDTQHNMGAIILTGYAELEDAVESMKTGVFDYISKGRPDLASELRIRVEKALTEGLREKSITYLIAKGESAVLEFKSSARWDIRCGKQSPEAEAVIVKTVAGFLNSELGGELLIGVDDNGQVVGLRHDYETLHRKNRDGFENFLLHLLTNACDKEVTSFIHIDFHYVDGKDVCCISVKPASRAIFVPDRIGEEHFFVRTGNATRRLTTRESFEYCKIRWK